MPIGAARLGFFKQPPPPPTSDFENPSFEDGLNNWSFIGDRVFLNGGTTILGYPTPNDTGTVPVNDLGRESVGDSLTASDFTTTYELSNLVPPSSGSNSVRLTNYCTGTAGSYVYGPAMYSNGRVVAEVGDTVSFFWRAVSSTNSSLSDAYKIYAYLIDSANGRTVELLNAWSSSGGVDTGWQQSTKVIAPGEDGFYHFVFINGSWDATFGTVIGAEFYIDNIQLIKV